MTNFTTLQTSTDELSYFLMENNPALYRQFKSCMFNGGPITIDLQKDLFDFFIQSLQKDSAKQLSALYNTLKKQVNRFKRNVQLNQKVTIYNNPIFVVVLPNKIKIMDVDHEEPMGILYRDENGYYPSYDSTGLCNATDEEILLVSWYFEDLKDIHETFAQIEFILRGNYSLAPRKKQEFSILSNYLLNQYPIISRKEKIKAYL